MKARLLVDAKCTLAEGIQWRADQQRLWWSDIHSCALWSCDEDGGDVLRRETPERLGSFAFDLDGHLLCAFESGLFRWDLDGDRLDRLTDFEPTHPTSRMNDGRCDRHGRFIAGGVNEDGLKPTSSVMRYAAGRAETVLSGIGCSNSICFSPDGRWMYFADTPTGQIQRYRYDADTGALGAPSVFYDDEAPGGFPDGSCIDADGALWNARFNGGCVQQILPDGTARLRIDVEAPQVTCACFGGADMDKLFITTARENMSETDVAQYPLSGGIFVAQPGATGLPEDRFAERLFAE
jgi:L-arabinonolactonase